MGTDLGRLRGEGARRRWQLAAVACTLAAVPVVLRALLFGDPAAAPEEPATAVVTAQPPSAPVRTAAEEALPQAMVPLSDAAGVAGPRAASASAAAAPEQPFGTVVPPLSALPPPIPGEDDAMRPAKPPTPTPTPAGKASRPPASPRAEPTPAVPPPPAAASAAVARRVMPAVGTGDGAKAAARVQLGAMGSEPAARREWETLRQRHPALLAGLRPTIVRADLGGGKVVYRVQAGPLTDEAAAARLCGQLRRYGVGCVVFGS
jgi:hypothetical protein